MLPWLQHSTTLLQALLHLRGYGDVCVTCVSATGSLQLAGLGPLSNVLDTDMGHCQVSM